MQSETTPFVNRLLCRLAGLLFRIAGWHTEGRFPDTPRFVVITTHTSSWDLPVGLLGVALLSDGFWRYRLAWIGKQELFRGPMAWVYRRLGGIPVDRSAPRGAVQQMVDAFRCRDRLSLAITPEGTRKRAPCWKSGFYHIAHQAQVPIVCGFLDFKRRAAGVGPVLTPSGDIEADMGVIRSFYSTVTPRYPQRIGEIRLRNEKKTNRKD